MVADTRRRGGNVGARLKGKSVVAWKAKAKFDARAFLARANGGVTVSNYRSGQVVFNQGDPADCIFFIQEGKVKVAVVSQQGKEAVIAFLEAGDFICEGCLAGA